MGERNWGLIDAYFQLVHLHHYRLQIYRLQPRELHQCVSRRFDL